MRYSLTSEETRPLDLDRAFEIEYGVAGDRDAVAAQGAYQLPAARRDLPRIEPRFAEPFRPIGRQHAMRRAGHPVLVDAVVRRKIARDEIDAVTAGGRRDHARLRDLAHRGEIGTQSRNLLGAVVDGESAAARDKALRWRGVERREYAGVGGLLLRRPGREVHRQQIAVTGYLERPGLHGVEPHRALFRRENSGHDITGGERRMPAQIDLDGRREPAQQIAVSLRHKECGLGEVVLSRDRLHRRPRQPFRQRAYRRRITAESAAGESIDLIERNAHDKPQRCQKFFAHSRATSARLRPTSRNMRSSSCWSKWRLRARARHSARYPISFAIGLPDAAGGDTAERRTTGDQIVSIQYLGMNPRLCDIFSLI